MKKVLSFVLVFAALFLFAGCEFLGGGEQGGNQGENQGGNQGGNTSGLTCAEDPTLEICSYPETWTWNYNRKEFDGKGMAIVIYHGAPEELDPFNDDFFGERQKEKQELLNTIEAEYNIDIQIKPYPAEAAWGPERAAWLNNNVASDNIQGDIYYISSDWIPTLAYGGSIAVLSNHRTGEGLFKELNYTQSTEKNKQYSLGNNVYGYSAGETHADAFLYYNQTLVDQFGLQDPATLWNNGQWDWSTFYAYLETAQSAFDAATGEYESKIYAFGGFVNDVARGMLAARGGKLIDPDSKLVLFTNALTLGTYNDLRSIWQNDMWAKDSTAADVSSSFLSGRQLFSTGKLWFLSSEQRFKNEQITFEISAVPYPTADGDAAYRQTYLIPMGADSGYAIRPVENGENGLNTFVLLNILDDFLRSSESTTSDALSERDLYILSLQKYISSQQSIDAIMSVEDNVGMYGYTDYMDILSIQLGNGSHWYGSGFCTWGLRLVTSDEDPRLILDAYKMEYQNKLNEILNA